MLETAFLISSSVTLKVATLEIVSFVISWTCSSIWETNSLLLFSIALADSSIFASSSLSSLFNSACDFSWNEIDDDLIISDASALACFICFSIVSWIFDASACSSLAAERSSLIFLSLF